jgi:hypothetical protein
MRAAEPAIDSSEERPYRGRIAPEAACIRRLAISDVHAFHFPHFLVDVFANVVQFRSFSSQKTQIIAKLVIQRLASRVYDKLPARLLVSQSLLIWPQKECALYAISSQFGLS